MTDQHSNHDEDQRLQARAMFDRGLQLLLDKDMRGFAGLWHDDGVFEFPFAPPGYPRLVEGREAVADYLKDYPDHIDLTGFRDVTVRHTTEPGTMVVEFQAEGRAIATGRPYDVGYIAVIETSDGRILRYRDYWNPLAVGAALGGVDAFVDAFTQGSPSIRDTA